MWLIFVLRKCLIYVWYFSHPGYPGDLLFLVRFRHRRRLRRLSANTFQFSGKTPEAKFFKPHMLDLWVPENCLAPISVTLGQGH